MREPDWPLVGSVIVGTAGVLGFVLSVYNTWIHHIDSLPKLHVRFLILVGAESGSELGAGVKITNVGKVATTVDQAGFTEPDQSLNAIIECDGVKLPCPLAPGASISLNLFYDRPQPIGQIIHSKNAYAKTADGRFYTGSSNEPIKVIVRGA